MSHDDINRQAFMEEAGDLLTELETALLELEDQPEDQDCIDRVFRCMHTIKGSGAMFGFDDISTFTHDVETAFDLVRNGVIPVTRELLDLTLASRDHIAYLLESEKTGAEIDFKRSEDLTRRLKEMAGEAAAPDEAERQPDKDEPLVDESEAEVTYRVRFKPNKEIFQQGSNPLALVEELSEMGSSMVFPHVEDLPSLDQVDPESCYVWWDVILTTNASREAIRDVFLFVEDDCYISVQVVDRDGMLDDDASYKRIGEILLERGDLTADDLKKILEDKKPLGEMLAEAGVVDKAVVQSALVEQKAVRKARQSRVATPAAVETASSIRVAAEKLDKLVDLVGELVIVQAQISQMVSQRNDPSMLVLAEQLELLSDDLRDSTLGIRMLPIGTTFSKFRRLVRDLSAELGKEIDLVTQGAETELDKTVIERLNDPLVHLLRNSIDHGIETPQERTAQGKPPKGTILLVAEHSGGDVLIRIEDDGKGMDAEAIREKAVERGLVASDSELSDKEIYSLIFLPGFSTAQVVTNVSGRGVGMDVVKRSIDSLRGSIEVESEQGKGTVITIKLPLTLAIIDGLQVRVEEEYYVLPLSLVEECVELSSRDEEGTGQRIVNLRGEIVPYIRLREFFVLEGIAPPIEQIVVVGVQGGRVGIVVDNVIGEHQTVIKSLGRVYRDVEGISGATIKGDGTMALILDVPKLVQLAGAS